MGRPVRFLLTLTMLASAVCHAQAGASKAEKAEEKLERMGAKTPAIQIKPDSLQKKAPVITFQSVPAQPYTGPILDFKNGPNGTQVPYDVRTGQYVNQDVRNTASWRRKDRIIYDIGSGAMVPKAVVDASDAAYKAKKAGAPDPAPETKKLSFDTDANLPDAEKKARAKELSKPKNHVEVWKAGTTGKTGINIEALGLKDGEVALVPENAYVDVKLKVGQVEGTAVTQANVGPDGVDVNINLEAKAVLIGVQAETGKLEAGDKMLGGSVYARTEAAILAEAKAQGHLKVGPDGVLVGAEGSLFAGGKAKLEVPATVTVGGVETRATVVGEVSYGIGIEGKVYTKITWTSVKFRAQGHAALGVGAGGEIDVEISVAELVKEIAPPKTPTLDSMRAAKSELNPLADHWTLSKDEYKKLAAGVLADDVNRDRALGEIKKRQDHWLGDLNDYTETKRNLREGAGDLGAPYARLQYELFRNNPDALAGYQAAIEEAKASGLANDSRWGGHKRKRLDEVIARNARVKTPFDSRQDFIVPETSYWYELDGKRYPLPSYTGPKGLDYTQQLGVADFWSSISDAKKKQVNQAMRGRSPDEQLDILKKLAGDEIAARIDSERDIQARPDTSWILDFAPPEVRTAAEKRFSAKQLNIMERTIGRDGRLVQQEILEMLDNGAPAAAIVSKLWERGAPSNTDWGRRARQETMLQGYPDGFNMYLRWLSGERKADQERRLGNTQTDQQHANLISHFTAALSSRDAAVDKTLATIGAQDGRYKNTTISGVGVTSNGTAKTADGAGMIDSPFNR